MVCYRTVFYYANIIVVSVDIHADMHHCYYDTTNVVALLPITTAHAITPITLHTDIASS